MNSFMSILLESAVCGQNERMMYFVSFIAQYDHRVVICTTWLLLSHIVVYVAGWSNCETWYLM